MERVPRARRSGEGAAGSSRLRLGLIIAVIAATVLALAASGGLRWLAPLAGWLAAGVPGGAVTLAAIAAGAVLLGAIAMLRRRGKSAAVPVRRAFRSQAAQAPRDGEPTMQVYGRGAFLSGLRDKLKAHAEEGRQLAVHRLDIDRFRQINHDFGSDAGDRVLGEVSRRLAELAGDPVHLARFGDDEFAIIQPETSGAKHAEIFAARMQKALEEPIALGEAEMPVTASIGIAVAPEHGPDAQRLVMSADLALQAAQRAGGGIIRFFAAEMDERRERRRALEGAVRQGLAEDEASRFVLRYHPQYDLGSRRLVGFEAQVRLQDRRLGAVDEAEFAAVAHDAGLLPVIAERAVREACRTAARWPQHLRLGFNLLPGHFASRDTAKLLSEAVKANHLSPGRVDLEVDEEVVCSDAEQADSQLRRLAEAGFRLVLDHYGSGHCGPGDLWRQPFGAIKIDAALIARLGAGEGAEALVGAIVKLGQALDLAVIADGVDGAEQVHFLMLNGCRNVAGPLLGPAVPADKLAAMIDKDAKSAEAEATAA